MTEEILAEELFDGVSRAEWMEELEKHDAWMRRHLFALWSVLGTPATMLDVGSGSGVLVKTSRELGIEAYGLDQIVWHSEDSPFDPGWFGKADLREPFSTGKWGVPNVLEWVICWEIAEHLPEEHHGILCDSLVQHVQRDGLLIFTSAHPGQGGKEHISERPAKYWRDAFHIRGLNYRNDIALQVVAAWNLIQSPLTWLVSNLQVFTK